MTPPPMNRRQALGAFGAVSLTGLLAACGSGDETAGSVTTTDGATATVETKTTTTAATKLTAAQFDSAANCRVATELTECPYYFDVDAIRSDIREDREGTLLRLGVRVREAAGCEPIENAIVPRQGDAADDPVLHDEGDGRRRVRPAAVQRGRRPRQGAAEPPPSNSAEAPRDDHALILDVDIDAGAVANGTDDQFDQLLGCEAAGLQAHRGKAHGLAAA